MSAELWDRQSGKADEGCHVRDLDSPKTKIPFVEMCLDVIDHCVALS